MGEIYAKAHSVFIWLGEKAQESDRAMGFLKLLAKIYRDHDSGKSRVLQLARDPSCQERWAALDLLWKRRWWGRAWVLQEVVLSRQGVVCCGRALLPQSDVFQAATMLREVLDELYTLLAEQYHIHLSMPTFHMIDGMRRILNARIQGTLFPMTTCHYRTMSPRVADERDFVFAKLGMASDGWTVNPSYTDSIEKVYTDYVIEHAKATGSLDIIHFDARPRRVEGISSWVPDWSAGFAADPLNPDHGGNPDINFPYYKASLGEKADIEVEDDDEKQILCCKGYILDAIDGVAHYEEDSWAGRELARPVQQPQSDKCAYTDRTEIFEGLWKALTINQEPSGEVADAKNGLLLAESFQAACSRVAAGDDVTAGESPRLRFDKFCGMLKDFQVLGGTVLERMKRATQDQTVPPASSAKRNDVETSMMNWYTFRRLLTTKDGYLGVGPPETLPSDSVAIIYGSSVPILLRQLESGAYIVLGEAYIHGIMYGEALKKMRNGGIEPVTIRLK